MQRLCGTVYAFTAYAYDGEYVGRRMWVYTTITPPGRLSYDHGSHAAGGATTTTATTIFVVISHETASVDGMVRASDSE